MRLIAKNARFITSAQNFSQCPSAVSSEIAFLGRSNVGKSSLLNFILGKNLAKSSSTPGKTRLINFFSVEFEETKDENSESRLKIPLTFVDLPGFGYAKVSKEMKARWERDLLDFLQRRSSIKLFIHLRDSRHPSLSQDDEVLDFLHNLVRADQKILTIFTKADKLKKNELSKLFMKANILASTQNIESSKIQNVLALRTLILQCALGMQ